MQSTCHFASVFLGTEFVNLDAKGRLSIPGRHRHAFEKDSDKHVTITRDEEGYLRIFQRPAWEHFLENSIKPESDPWIKRTWLGSAMEVKLDATFRLLVSPELRAGVGLVREAKLIGMDDHFELWDKATHDAKHAEAKAARASKKLPQGTAA